MTEHTPGPIVPIQLSISLRAETDDGHCADSEGLGSAIVDHLLETFNDDNSIEKIEFIQLDNIHPVVAELDEAILAERIEAMTVRDYMTGKELQTLMEREGHRR